MFGSSRLDLLRQSDKIKLLPYECFSAAPPFLPLHSRMISFIPKVGKSSAVVGDPAGLI